MEQRIAIITARGGSKRIPRKNIRSFCGKPIIAYSIIAAKKSGLFDEVMVSTDDEEIARIAGEYGASVPFMRSAETSDDFATTRDVIREVIGKYKELGREFEYVACIYPTAPFVTSQVLQEAVKVLDESGATCLEPVVAYSFPIQRSYAIEDNRIQKNCPGLYGKRSQDLQKMYHDAGQFYIGKTEFVIENGFASSDTVPFILSETDVQDIDTITDWKLAELKFKMRDGE